jgi:dipeptidyl aminopeptidase/acylaminoacyl peptidase
MSYFPPFSAQLTEAGSRNRFVRHLGPRTLVFGICAAFLLSGRDVRVCPGEVTCAGKNPLIASIKVLVQSGARPHWSPSGESIVFDRRDASGYAHLWLTDLRGNERPLTAGDSEVGSRNSGNGVFHPSGKYIVFIAEEPRHFMDHSKEIGDPGVGLFCNLWATTPDGHQFWRLTQIPVKLSLLDRMPVMGVVNPHFSPDGSRLFWTERYNKGGGNWGLWRVQSADFSVARGVPKLANVRSVLTAGRGNYITAMGFLNSREVVVAGNLDGQHEYGMDLYVVNLDSQATLNLTKTPELWEEGSCVTPMHRDIIYMSNEASPYKLDFGNSNWAAQPIERDYWIMDSSGTNKRRLTWFNDPAASEYLGGRNIVASCDVSPDGRFLAGTLGIDVAAGKPAKMELKIVVLRFNQPQ